MVENVEWYRHGGNKVLGVVVVYVTILVVGATEDPTPAETADKDYDKPQKQKE